MKVISIVNGNYNPTYNWWGTTLYKYGTIHHGHDQWDAPPSTGCCGSIPWLPRLRRPSAAPVSWRGFNMAWGDWEFTLNSGEKKHMGFM